MDAKFKFEMKVGVFVFVGLAVFAYIVFSISDFYIFKPGYRIKVRFSFVDGIQASAPIRYAGVEVGKLENIKFYYSKEKEKTEVELKGWITKDAFIEKNAEAYINTLGVVGEKYLEILPGTREAGFLADGDELIGIDPVPMEKITHRAYEITENLQKFTDGLKEGQGTIGKLMTDDSVYNNLEEFTADIKAHPWKLLIKGREKSV
ncbi:MAG: hypothetical protein COU52_05235, partial [Candidatus Omnitrophica bacterium CG10_big_fil_rev_8_21_14_0_10_43_8]